MDETKNTDTAGGTRILGESPTVSDGTFTGGLLQAHETIAGWEILKHFAVNTGEADVYLAEKEGKKGVIKSYRNTRKAKTEVLDKIRDLHHPHVIDLYGYGYHQGRFFEIMEYAAGSSLDKYLPLSEETVLRVCKDVIEAFKVCHDAGIIHRDIKPANLYYRQEGAEVLIADFGISSIMDEASLQKKTQTASRTTGYAAPEVFSGIISPKMDYYALGITLWELLTGADPFVLDNGKRRNDAHLIRDTIEGRIADDLLRADKPPVSPNMARLIRGLLVVDDGKRWGYDEVTRHLAGEMVEVSPMVKTTWAFTVGESRCTTLEQLGDTLLKNPEAAQKYVYKNMLALTLEPVYPDIAQKIGKIAEDAAAKKSYYNGILRVAYLLNPALPLPLANGFSVANLDDVLFLLAQAPETVLPFFRNTDSKLYAYLEVLGRKDQAAEIRDLVPAVSDVDLLGKVEVILRDKVIRPFTLEKYRDVELSTLEQIKRIPKDMQNRMLAIIDERSYEGLFLPWVELLSPMVTLDDVKTGSWAEFLESLSP